MTSAQVAPPSLLTCTFSPAPSAPWVPDTVSVVSLVMKSLDRAAVGGNRRDRHRRRRRRRVDGHGLAVGGADIARGVDDPRLVGEARAVRVGGST